MLARGVDPRRMGGGGDVRPEFCVKDSSASARYDLTSLRYTRILSRIPRGSRASSKDTVRRLDYTDSAFGGARNPSAEWRAVA